MNKKTLGKGLLAGATLAAGYFAVGNYFYNVALKKEKKPFLENNPNLPAGTSGEDRAREARKQEREEWLKTVEQRPEKLMSFDGLQLIGTSFLQKSPTHEWAILVHGYLSNRYAMQEMAFQFYQYGFNVLTIDCRGSGESQGDYTTMGWLDRLDVRDWCNKLVSDDPKSTIVLYGISMGGATVMMTSGETLPENVKCIVEDCGYTSAYGIFSYQLKELFHLPSFPVMNAASTVTNLRSGFTLKEASSVEQLKKNHLPIFFIHGDADTFVPFSMLEEVVQATKGEKEVYVVAGAPHGGAYAHDPKIYMEKVMRFILRAFMKD